ncbi:MAG TPA: DnaB-like helicase N-terminal domain-containing protein [Chryseosolibacter sp.]|nr:DnaB-like helicase N-terminal domain-containing protein [Chryseosolibacter sp.]
MNVKSDFTYRIDLEQAILGACILEGCALPIVADILTDRNFTDNTGTGYDHSAIFRCLLSMYPKYAVDLLTVRRALPGHDVYLATLTSKVSSTAHLKQHSLILLQLDITEKFRQLISTIMSKSDNSITQVACTEIIASLEPDADVFDVIDTAISYLTNLRVDDLAIAQVRGFSTQISARVKKIKNLNGTETLLRNFEQLKPRTTDPLTSLAYDRLQELLKSVIATGSLDVRTAKVIMSL